MTFAFWLVDGLPERWLLSTNVQPSLKQLNHYLICVAPIASSPKSPLNLLDCFRFGISTLLAKLDAVSLLHAFSHYWAKWTSTHYSTSYTSCLGEKDAPGKAAKKSHIHMKPPPPSAVIRFANLPSLVFPGKNKVGYFLNRVVFSPAPCHLHHMDFFL
jgi:hypothetical protein